ncbi:MAG: hypothetical protein MAG453_00148 [Calditrichaeota bacterium]|nr:hypothetical protein [Calditrichota bacterium]
MQSNLHMDKTEQLAARMRGSHGIPDLMIESATVNPAGKRDRLAGPAPNELVNHEWVQLRNMTDHILVIDGMELKHLVYGPDNQSRFSRVFTLQGRLPGKSLLRIHSGRGKPFYENNRNIYHAYVNPNRVAFFYQIVRNDTLAIVRANGLTLDQVDYYVPVPENVRLKRVAPIPRRLLQPVR